MAFNIGETVYVKARLESLPDRNDIAVVSVPNGFGGSRGRFSCRSFFLTRDKTNTEQILKMLKHEYENMIKETEDISECELITKIFKKAEEIVRFYQ